MASRTKTCDFCGKKMRLIDMIDFKNKAKLCDIGCVDLWVESYSDEEEKKEYAKSRKEVKPIAKGVGNSK